MQTSNTINIVSNVEKFNIIDYINELERVKKHEIFNSSKTDYTIVVVDKISEELRLSIEVLNDTLNKLAKANIFKISSTKNSSKSIIIKPDNSRNDLIDDGYFIETKNNDIYIGGLSEHACANGVYRFIENYLGCMFIRHDYTYIPNIKCLYLDDINEVSNPDFRWREFFQYEVKNTDWSYKLLLNGSKDTAWGTWCHSIYEFVDDEKYYKTHPEYFSYRLGKRRLEQLCLSNKNIRPIISDSLNKMIKENPDALYWDFSINDNGHYCGCKECKKQYKKYHAKVGNVIEILNMLAKEHPDKIISTLAYWYNEKAPKNIELEPNINIKLAPIKSGQKYAFVYKGNWRAIKTYNLIKSWSKYADNICVWDYAVNYRHTQMPYPNFDVQRDNLQFYKDNNVKQIFHQGMNGVCTEMYALRSYVMSRQLWNINEDIDKLIAKYLVIAYGKAAIYIAQYMELSNHIMKTRAVDLDLYDWPHMHWCDYLSPSAVNKYMDLIDKAFDAEKGNEEILYRLEEIKINILYARLTTPTLNLKLKKQTGIEFKRLANKHKIDRYNELNKPTLDDFFKKHHIR